MATLEAQVAHTWRRLGFGPTIDDIDAGVASGTQSIIDDLTTRPATTEADWGFPTEDSWQEMTRFGEVAINNMALTSNPLQERLAWILTGLTVVSLTGPVKYPDMYDYEKLCRNRALGSYKQLLSDLVTHPGMLWYLSGIHSTKWHPNENFARELMELFSLGSRHVVTGESPYTEGDIAEISRCLTGYRWDWDDHFSYFHEPWWDDGDKTFLGSTHVAGDVEDVLDTVCSQDAWSYFVPHRLWLEFVGTEPSQAVLDSLAPVWGPDGDLLAVVAAIAQHPEFTSDAAIRSRVKSPVELIASGMRMLGHDECDDFYTTWRLFQLGYHPLYCPSVSGWPAGSKLLHSTYLMIWSELARKMCWLDDGDDDVAEADRCVPIRRLYAESTAASAVDFCRRLAGLESLTPKTQSALQSYADAGTWNFRRAAGLMNLLLVSPEFIAN